MDENESDNMDVLINPYGFVVVLTNSSDWWVPLCIGFLVTEDRGGCVQGRLWQ